MPANGFDVLSEYNMYKEMLKRVNLFKMHLQGVKELVSASLEVCTYSEYVLTLARCLGH